MRIKVVGRLLDWPEKKSWIPTHDIYAMLLNRLGLEQKARAHSEVKQTCLFTFSKITIDDKKKTFHFYFSSTPELTKQMVDSFYSQPYFHVNSSYVGKKNKYIMEVRHTTILKELPIRDRYLFKGRILASSGDRKQVLTKTHEIEALLEQIGKHKLTQLGFVDPDVQIMVYSREDAETRYECDRYDMQVPANRIKKAVRIPSHFVTLGVSGDYQAIEALYSIGFGQNTGTGNGLLWEV